MKREWKPGDVAAGSIHGYTGLFIFRGEGGGWDQADGVDGGWDGRYIKDLRPLVVIDPEDREQVERLVEHLVSSNAYYGNSRVGHMQTALREFANPTPPKPEEPTGLGAVVEDAKGVPWVRCENVDLEPHWYARNKQRQYVAIDAVKVLSEGVTS